MRDRILPLLTREAGVKVAAMGDSEFWKEVEAIKWARPSTNYRDISKKLLLEWTPEKAKAFHEKMNQLRGKLYKAITDAEKRGVIEQIPVGDDSFSDLLHHIIGLGKREYDAVMKDPKKALDRVRRDDFVESFGYAIPHPGEWARLDFKRYRQWAAEQDHEYEQASTNKFAGPLKPHIKTIRDAMKLMAEGKMADFLATEKKVETALSKLQEDIKSMAEIKSWIGNPWAVKNLYSDVKQYLPK